MSDLIGREAAEVYLREALFGAGCSVDQVEAALYCLRALPAAPAEVIKALALLSDWLETPNEGDPMIDVLLGVIREAHAALEGGEA